MARNRRRRGAEPQEASEVSRDSRVAASESKSGKAGPLAAPSTEEIARLAYEMWEREGRIDGNDQRHWLEAERILRNARKG